MNLDALLAHKFEAKTVTYDERDTMLYALSLGAGSSPHEEVDLNFVYEKNLLALPTISAALAHPGAWMTDPKFDINLVKLLHVEQRTRFYQAIAPSGTIKAEYRVSAIVDKGAAKGALMYFDKDLYNAINNELLCTVKSCYLLRDDGGCGEFGTPPAPLAPTPSGTPDYVDEHKIDDRAALFYRLNGDRNPLHIDPAIAQKAGFAKPIIHGLYVYGICGLTLTRQILNADVSRMASLALRFSAPAYPGETLIIEAWQLEGGITFRATAKERNQVVINNGFIDLN